LTISSKEDYGILKYDSLYIKYNIIVSECQTILILITIILRNCQKRSRGLGYDTDFGEVQEILGECIITQKGSVTKDRFYIPGNLVERFDGDTVYFKITKDEAKEYKRD
jgi:hypothetical protein